MLSLHSPNYYYFASAAVAVDSSHMTKSSSASRNRFSPPSNFVNQVNARNDCELCDSTTNVVLVIIFIIISHHYGLGLVPNLVEYFVFGLLLHMLGINFLATQEDLKVSLITHTHTPV